MKIKDSFQFELLKEGKEGKDWDVVLIQAGESKNGRYYSPEVLKKSLALFENAKAYAFEFSNRLLSHLPDIVKNKLPFGFAKNLVGWYDNVRYSEFRNSMGETKEGIIARFHIHEGALWLRKLLRDAWQEGKKMLLGFSIDGDGSINRIQKNGHMTDDVTEIKSIGSVDLVTNPAAGGQLLRLMADKQGGLNNMNWLKKIIEFVKTMKPEAIEGIDPENVTETQELDLIEIAVSSDDFPGKIGSTEEANEVLVSMIKRVMDLLKDNKTDQAIQVLQSLMAKVEQFGYPAKSAPPANNQASAEDIAKKKKEDGLAMKTKEDLQKLIDDTKKINEDIKKRNCLGLLNLKLGESKLPEPVQKKIRKSFEGKIFEEQELDDAIKVEKDTLAELTKDGNVVGLGENRIEVITEEYDKKQSALNRMFDPEAEVDDKLKSVGAFRGLKEAYKAFHPEDPEISGQTKPFSLGRIAEEITSSDFTYALTVSMTKAVVRMYKLRPFKFDPITTKRSVSDFKTQENIKWGGWGILPTVSTESAAFADLYEPKDEKATFAVTTKGGYVRVTRVTIKNDDLGFIRQIPKKLVRAAQKTLERDIAALLYSNSTYTPDNTTVFNAAHANYATSALDYDTLNDAKKLMREQKERGAQQGAAAVDSATATGLTATGDFAGDTYATYYVRITYGPGAGQTRVISSHNDDTLVITPAWSTNPTSASLYEITSQPEDDEMIELEPKFILHGTKLIPDVDVLINSETRPDEVERSRNSHYKTLTPILIPKLTGTYDDYWFLAAPKTDIDGIGVAYMDGKEVPTLVIQDQAYAGQVFTNDKISWKVRFEFIPFIDDYRALTGNIL